MRWRPSYDDESDARHEAALSEIRTDNKDGRRRGQGKVK
jgi:hypothetical protein